MDGAHSTEAAPYLLDLTVDCLAHIASYVDTHTLVYSVGVTCHALHDIANDPVVWATSVVCPGSDVELLHLARKHPTIRYIDGGTANVEVAAEVAALCKEIVYWGALFDYGGHGDWNNGWSELALGLQSQNVGRGGSVLPAAYESLRRLDIHGGKGDSATILATAAEHCPNVTDLTFRSFAESFWEVCPRGFPRLTRLIGFGGHISPASWAEFVSSHTELTSLGVQGVKPDPEYSLTWNEDGEGVDFARDTAVWEQLGNLTALVATAPYVPGLCYGLLESNPGLTTLSWSVPTDSSAMLAPLTERALTAFSRCVHLRELVLSRHTFGTDNLPAVAAFAEAVSLKTLKLSTLGGPPDPRVVAAMLPVLAPDCRQLHSWCLSDRCLSTLRPSLRNLTEMVLPGTQSLSVDSYAILGTEMRHLRDLRVQHAHVITEPACTALAPALRALTSLHLLSCTEANCPLLVGAAASPQLRSLELHVEIFETGNPFPEDDEDDEADDVRVMRSLLHAFVAAWNGPCLERLVISSVDDKLAEWLFGLAKEGKLNAVSAAVRLRDENWGDSWTSEKVCDMQPRACGLW